MSENALAYTTDAADAGATNLRPRAFDTIIYGGLAVGVLDALDALVFFGLVKGVPHTRIFQSIAGGLLGPSAFNGGPATVLLGVALHFLIAFIIAAVYYFVSLRLPLLIRHAVTCGLLYGLAAYFVMNYVVVPLAAAPAFKSSPSSFLNGMIGHIFLVGLPVALVAQWSARRNAER